MEHVPNALVSQKDIKETPSIGKRRIVLVGTHTRVRISERIKEMALKYDIVGLVVPSDPGNIIGKS